MVNRNCLILRAVCLQWRKYLLVSNYNPNQEKKSSACKQWSQQMRRKKSVQRELTAPYCDTCSAHFMNVAELRQNTSHNLTGFLDLILLFRTRHRLTSWKQRGTHGACICGGCYPRGSVPSTLIPQPNSEGYNSWCKFTDDHQAIIFEHKYWQFRAGFVSEPSTEPHHVHNSEWGNPTVRIETVKRRPKTRIPNVYSCDLNYDSTSL